MTPQLHSDESLCFGIDRSIESEIEPFGRKGQVDWNVSGTSSRPHRSCHRLHRPKPQTPLTQQRPPTFFFHQINQGLDRSSTGPGSSNSHKPASQPASYLSVTDAFGWLSGSVDGWRPSASLAEHKHEASAMTAPGPCPPELPVVLHTHALLITTINTAAAAMATSTGQMRGLNKGYPVQKLEVPKRPAQRKGVSA